MKCDCGTDLIEIDTSEVSEDGTTGYIMNVCEKIINVVQNWEDGQLTEHALKDLAILENEDHLNTFWGYEMVY